MPAPSIPWPLDFFFERYENKIMPEPNTGCLIWLGAAGGSGYGHIYRAGKYIDVHRCAFAAATGWLPPVVRHSCDLKLCVNEAHLLAGSPQENSNDSVARNLIPHGEDHTFAKLTVQQVREIRAYSGPFTQRELGRQYGIAQCAISEIKAGKRWRRA